MKKSYGGIDSYYQGSVLTVNEQEVILTGEGRVVNNGGWQYEYDLKDHLGNTRVSFKVDTIRAVPLQYKDYYPFGMEMANWYATVGTPTKFLYNGKELQDEGGLDWYDYGARFYDPVLARFTTIDPLTEKNHSQSGFVYAANNPIKYIDFMGLDSMQRAQAVELANKYVKDNPGNSWATGRGAPGEKTDCSGMVSSCIIKAEEPDPYAGKKGNGVSRIVESSDKVENKNDAETGNAITLDNSASGEDKPLGHIGIIVEIKRNDKGETTGYKIADSGGRPSTGKSGPRYTNITLGGKGYWDNRVTGIYKWDKRPDVYNAGTLKSVTISAPGSSYLSPITSVGVN